MRYSKGGRHWQEALMISFDLFSFWKSSVFRANGFLPFQETFPHPLLMTLLEDPKMELKSFLLHLSHVGLLTAFEVNIFKRGPFFSGLGRVDLFGEIKCALAARSFGCFKWPRGASQSNPTQSRLQNPISFCFGRKCSETLIKAVGCWIKWWNCHQHHKATNDHRWHSCRG